MLSDQEVLDGYPEDEVIVLVSETGVWGRIYIRDQQTMTAAWDSDEDAIVVDQDPTLHGGNWPEVIRAVAEELRLIGRGRVVNVGRTQDQTIFL